MGGVVTGLRRLQRSSGVRRVRVGAPPLREAAREARRRGEGRLGRRLGGLYLALSDEPQSTVAWGSAARANGLLGEYLESLHDGARVIVLHDRRIPGSRANIDHIAICRSGIYAIDAKNYTGKVQRIDKGGWFSTDAALRRQARLREARARDGETG